MNGNWEMTNERWWIRKDKYHLKDEDRKKIQEVKPKTIRTHYIYFSTEGTNKTGISCGKAKAVDVLKKLDWTMKIVILPQKSITIMISQWSFFKMKTQLFVIGHRLNLYFYEWKLAIIYDEKKHEDKDIHHEVWKQRTTEKELGCDFISVNSDNPWFYYFW